MDIQISHLEKNYRRFQALADINLDIQTGMFGLLGPNGAGKTTLMRIMATLLPFDRGEIRINQINLASQPDQIRSFLGYIPQSFGFYKSLTGFDMLDYIAQMKNIPAGKRKSAVEQAIEHVNLQEAARRKIGTYSGGMRQRLGIAQALLGDPQLIIVDEPTAGLDPEERVRFRNLFAGLAEKRTVILSTHIVADIEASCAHLAILNRGRVAFVGSPLAMSALANDRVWTLTCPASHLHQLEQNGQIISTRQAGDLLAVRILAAQRPSADAQIVEPSLEDGYLALLDSHRPMEAMNDRH
jgi:ABC-type multidrug transport system ATPase subunit